MKNTNKTPRYVGTENGADYYDEGSGAQMLSYYGQQMTPEMRALCAQAGYKQIVTVAYSGEFEEPTAVLGVSYGSKYEDGEK